MHKDEVSAVRNHLNYICTEGWTSVQAHLFQTPSKEGLVLTVKYSDDAGNQGGEFWTIPLAAFEEIQELLEGRKIPISLELPPEPSPQIEEERKDANKDWREGYSDGYSDGYAAGRTDAEDEQDGEDWRGGSGQET